MSNKNQRGRSAARFLKILLLVVPGVLFLSCDIVQFENPFIHPSAELPPELGKWTRVIENAPVFPRMNFSAAVFDDAIWIIGGRDNTGTSYDDLWRSTDGREWAQVVAGNTAFSIDNPGFVAFEDRLFLNNHVSNELYVSSDGENWSFAINTPAVYTRLIVLGGALWAVAPSTGEVWRSETPEDELSWIMEDDGSSLTVSGDESTTITAHRGEIWAIGRGIIDDVWSYRPGSGWRKINSSGSFNRNWTQVVSYDGFLWMLGGRIESGDDPGGTVKSDVHVIKTEDNADAVRVRPDPPWDPRERFGVVAFRDRVYIFGGSEQENENPRTDVWHARTEHFWD